MDKALYPFFCQLSNLYINFWVHYIYFSNNTVFMNKYANFLLKNNAICALQCLSCHISCVISKYDTSVSHWFHKQCDSDQNKSPYKKHHFGTIKLQMSQTYTMQSHAIFVILLTNLTILYTRILELNIQMQI